jgi:hypothetical protein
MAAKNVGAIMVIETIISSEFLPSAMSCFGSSRGGLTRTRLADVMTRAPHTVDPDKPLGYALLVM